MVFNFPYGEIRYCCIYDIHASSTSIIPARKLLFKSFLRFFLDVIISLPLIFISETSAFNIFLPHFIIACPSFRAVTSVLSQSLIDNYNMLIMSTTVHPDVQVGSDKISPLVRGTF